MGHQKRKDFQRRQEDHHQVRNMSMVVGGVSTWFMGLSMDVAKAHAIDEILGWQFILVHLFQFIGVVLAIFGAKKMS
jgi:hypothetical protein